MNIFSDVIFLDPEDGTHNLYPFIWNMVYLSIVSHQDIPTAVFRYEWGDTDHIFGSSSSFINHLQVSCYLIPLHSGACTYIRNRDNVACTKSESKMHFFTSKVI